MKEEKCDKNTKMLLICHQWFHIKKTVSVSFDILSPTKTVSPSICIPHWKKRRMDAPRDARIYRRQPFLKRIADIPVDCAVNIQNEFAALDWDALQERIR